MEVGIYLSPEDCGGVSRAEYRFLNDVLASHENLTRAFRLFLARHECLEPHCIVKYFILGEGHAFFLDLNFAGATRRVHDLVECSSKLTVGRHGLIASVVAAHGQLLGG